MPRINGREKSKPALKYSPLLFLGRGILLVDFPQWDKTLANSGEHLICLALNGGVSCLKPPSEVRPSASSAKPTINHRAGFRSPPPHHPTTPSPHPPTPPHPSPTSYLRPACSFWHRGILERFSPLQRLSPPKTKPAQD